MRNKLFSRVLAIVLTLVCVLTMVPISASAAETDIAETGATYSVTFDATDSVDADGNQIKRVKGVKFENGAVHEKGSSHYIIKVDGETAYCIEPGVHLWAGDTLTAGASKIWSALSLDARNAIQSAMAFGADGNMSYLQKQIRSLTFGEAYVATQVIIWEFKEGHRSSVAPYSLNKGKSGYIDAYCADGKNPNIKKAYDTIIESLAKFQLRPSFTQNSEDKAPTITLKATYDAEKKQWLCESLPLVDANGVLSSFPELFGKHDAGNGQVVITRDGNNAVFTATDIYSGGREKTITISAEKSNIPVSNAGNLVAYGATGDVQDVVKGYDIDPPSAYLKVNIDTSGSYTRDGRIQKVCYTKSEYEDENVLEGEGTLSVAENLEGWYFYVKADSLFVNAYGVESFILGPTDSNGFTKSLADYVIENIDPNITHGIPEGSYAFWELGRLKEGADGTDLENDYYFPDNWHTYHKYGDEYPTGRIRTDDLGGSGFNNNSYAHNYFTIPLRVFKVNEPNVSLENFFFTATNNATGEVFLLRTAKGTGSAYVVGTDGSIDSQYSKYNTGDGVYDNFLPEGDYVLHELGKVNYATLLGSRDFENDYSIPAYFDKPVDVSFSVSSEGYKLAQDSGLDTIEVYAYNTVSSYIAIQKKDADTGAVLAGAKYGLFANETAETPIEELITDSNGYARTVNKYPTGTYLIKELEAPLYYEKNDTVYTVNVVPTTNVDNIVLIDVEDTLIPTTVKIYKHETGNVNIPLKGAVFALYSDKACTKEIEEITTGSDGYAIFSPVRPGTFYLKELSAPMYYQKSDAVMKVEVSKTTVQDKVITINIDNSLITSKVMLSKTDKDTGKPLQGAVYGIFKNKECTALLEELVTDAEGKAISEDDYKPGTVLYIQELTAPDTYMLDVTVHTVTVPKSKTENAYVRIEASDSLIPLYVNVYKTDEETHTPLAGAEFALYSDKDCKTSPLEILITGTDGMATSIKAYKPGTFYLKETKAPTGYIKSDEITKVVLSPTNEYGKVVSFGKTNPKGKTHIALEKLDKDTKEKLEGAVYGLYTDITCSVLLEELTTDENGYAQTKEKYPSNTYFIKEIKEPEGYELDETKHIVYISPEDAVNGTLKGTVVRKTVEDEKKPSYIRIAKLDSDYNPLSGAIFAMYSNDTCTVLLETLEPTDDNGYAITNNSYKPGTYYFKEIKAPLGYKLDDSVFSVVIETTNATDNTITIGRHNYTEDIPIAIQKKDAETGALLKGAVYGVYNNTFCIGAIEMLTTDENGYAQSKEEYGPGVYYIREITPPEGYEINYTKYTINITMEEIANYIEYGEVVLLEVEDEPITTNISIKKTCQQTGLPVSGAAYCLYSTNSTNSDGVLNGTFVSTVITDINGIATFKNVKVGKTYYIQEWSHGVPEGYTWNKQIYTVTATEGDNAVIVNVTNNIKTGTVHLTKTDSNGNPLQGVQFEVYRASDDTKVPLYCVTLSASRYAYSKSSKIYTIATNAQGKIELVTFPIGDYYLKEVGTVDGYMPYYGKIYFSVELENSSDSSAKTIYIDVPNNLPITWSTGGEGIMPFYYSAIIALTLSAVLLAVPTIKYMRRTKKSH